MSERFRIHTTSLAAGPFGRVATAYAGTEATVKALRVGVRTHDVRRSGADDRALAERCAR